MPSSEQHVYKPNIPDELGDLFYFILPIWNN